MQFKNLCFKGNSNKYTNSIKYFDPVSDKSKTLSKTNIPKVGNKIVQETVAESRETLKTKKITDCNKD